MDLLSVYHKYPPRLERGAGRPGGVVVMEMQPYRGTSLMRKRTPLGPYSRTKPRALWGS